MSVIIYSVIVWLATFIGSITGLGGGIVIKPAFDMVGMDTAVLISVYSTIAVFSMCLVSIYKRSREKNQTINQKLALSLAIGSIIGGLIGDKIFGVIVDTMGNRIVSLSQSFLLILILLGILGYAVVQKKVKTLEVSNSVVIFCIGAAVGAISVFLGIGGGPLNIVLLLFFFSMKAKEAAFYSIVMIFFAQVTKMLAILWNFSSYIDHIDVMPFLVIFAVLGGYVGTLVQKKLTHEQVSRLYNVLMLLLLIINMINFYNKW